MNSISNSVKPELTFTIGINEIFTFTPNKKLLTIDDYFYFPYYP
jgi:hypothetical protein